jgi:tetratricopeptide (TPR) repeat protein
MDLKQLFGSKVQRQRLKKNLSQHALTMEGISRQAVSKIELGAYLPPVELCSNFSNALGLPPDYFYRYYLKSLTSTQKIFNILKYFIKQKKWAYVIITLAQYRRITGTKMDNRQYSLILFKLSLHFYRSKKYHLSARVFELAISNYNSEDPRELGKLYLRLAKIYMIQNKKHNEIETLIKAKDCFSKVDSLCYKQLIFSLGKTAMFYTRNRNFDSAQEYFKKIISYGNKHSDYYELSRAYNGISLVYFRNNQLQLALDYAKKSLETYHNHEKKNEKLLHGILNNMGFYYAEMGLFTQAEEILKSLLDTKIDTLGLFHTKNELFRININRKEKSKADELADFLNTLYPMVSIEEKGYYYRYKGDYLLTFYKDIKEALLSYEKSASCFLEVDNITESRRSLRSLLDLI